MKSEINAKLYQSILLKNGRLVDPSIDLDKKADILIQNGKIQQIGNIDKSTSDTQTVDCKGCVIAPGFLDMHVHLREPGQEEKETIASGCRAAMAGGFTGVACMPNTQPPVDCRADVDFILERASGLLTDVYPVAAITMGQKGETLTEMAELAAAGAVAFSDDGHPVTSANRFRHAMEYAHMVGKRIIEHSEEPELSAKGVMHEGYYSTLLGMDGIPAVSETIAVSRNIQICEYLNIPVHIAHVSAAGSVQLIRDAKARGVPVTAETCPHYLVLTDEDVQSFDTNLKMNPPLRSKIDQEALIQGLQDGTLDVIATDHAPHTLEDKEVEFKFAAFGILGMETAIGIVLTHLVHKNILTIQQMIQAMAIHPREILDLPIHSIEKGSEANLTILNPDLKWKVDVNAFQSLSRNSPFDGWEMKGKAVGLVNGGMMWMEK